MKIGIIHGFIGGGGGTEKTLHAIIEALEKTEHDVTLYTFSKPKIKTRIRVNTTLPFSIPLHITTSSCEARNSKIFGYILPPFIKNIIVPRDCHDIKI